MLQTAALWLFIVALAVPFVSVVGGVLFLAIARRSHRSSGSLVGDAPADRAGAGRAAGGTGRRHLVAAAPRGRARGRVESRSVFAGLAGSEAARSASHSHDARRRLGLAQQRAGLVCAASGRGWTSFTISRKATPLHRLSNRLQRVTQ